MDATTKTPAELCDRLLALAGLGGGSEAGNHERLSAEVVRFGGPDVVLPSSYRVTDAASALVGAVSVAVAGVADLRAGPTAPPRIDVDSVEACAAFQSERHFKLDTPAQLWDGLSGHYETADGHIQFHTNFPHHRAALLAATGCSEDADRDAVAAVVARSGRFELEARVSEAGGIAAALRSVEEWNRHPHARHVADRPPLIVTTAGHEVGTGFNGGDRDSPVTPAPLGTTDRERPLAGLRILDMTRVIAGPVCTRTLAAYGADVLRIGAPDLPVVNSILPDTTLGKRFANCDIATDDGRARLLDLAADADVVVTGFRPGTLADKGVGPEELLAANPHLVVAQLSAFGPDGPWGGRRGFDSITQTATGIVASETEAFGAGRPRPLPCQLLDHGSGFLLALGVLAALTRRHESGGGHRVDVSLLTTRNWLASLGRADPEAGRQLDDAAVAPYLATRPSPFGPLSHVGHPGRIEGIASRWDRGPSKPGADPATW